MLPLLLANHWPAPAVLLAFLPWVVIVVVMLRQARKREKTPSESGNQP